MKIFSSTISSNCFETAKFSINSEPNEKKIYILLFIPEVTREAKRSFHATVPLRL
jgi:hypothetical protein